jgi:serine/threonine protein kinase
MSAAHVEASSGNSPSLPAASVYALNSSVFESSTVRSPTQLPTLGWVSISGPSQDHAFRAYGQDLTDAHIGWSAELKFTRPPAEITDELDHFLLPRVMGHIATPVVNGTCAEATPSDPCFLLTEGSVEPSLEPLPPLPWSASGTTGACRLCELSVVIASSATPLGLPLLDPATAVAQGLMVLKRIRHDGDQGAMPGEREAAFAVRAIEHQTKVSASNGISAVELNRSFLAQRAVALPAALHQTREVTKVVMPFVPYESIASVLTQFSSSPSPDLRVPVGLVRRIVRDVALALTVLHDELSAVHHDITPENVLLMQPFSSLCNASDDNSPICALCDFGCSSLLAPQDGSADFVGSIGSMSPERLSGGLHGPPSDIWSVGILGLHALLGRHPCSTVEHAPSLHAQQRLFVDCGEPSPTTCGKTRPVSPNPLPPGGSQINSFWRLINLFGAGHADVLTTQARCARFSEEALKSVAMRYAVDGLDHTLMAAVGRCLDGDPDKRPSAQQLYDELAFLR